MKLEPSIDKLLSSDDIFGSVIALYNCISELCTYAADLNKLTEEQALLLQSISISKVKTVINLH